MLLLVMVFYRSSENSKTLGKYGSFFSAVMGDNFGVIEEGRPPERERRQKDLEFIHRL